MDDSVVSDWMANTLPAIILEYKAQDVFNTDEEGSNTLHVLRRVEVCTELGYRE